MKPLSILIAVLLTAFAASAQLVITNPPARVTLAWDQSPDATVTGYRLYWGPASGFYTNFVEVAGRSNTSATIGPLVRGTTYHFAATARATDLESDFSNEVTYTPRALPPKPVLRLAISADGKVLFGFGEAYAEYQVQRTAALPEWSSIGTATASGDGTFSYCDPYPQRLAFYRVKAS